MNLKTCRKFLAREISDFSAHSYIYFHRHKEKDLLEMGQDPTPLGSLLFDPYYLFKNLISHLKIRIINDKFQKSFNRQLRVMWKSPEGFLQIAPFLVT